MQFAKKNAESYPLESKIIIRDFYIDNLLSGADSQNEILQMQKDVSYVLFCGGFELSKWFVTMSIF